MTGVSMFVTVYSDKQPRRIEVFPVAKILISFVVVLFAVLSAFKVRDSMLFEIEKVA